MNPIPADDRSTPELVNIVLTNNADAADSPYWDAIRLLHLRGTQDIFEAARSLCESLCSVEQRIGCDILAQLGCPERPFAAISFPLVASVVQRTKDLDTLASGLFALGWLYDLRAVDVVLPFVHHADSEIRYCVTSALTALNDDERSIVELIRLTTDSSDKVRDWATFGLGSNTEHDTPAIRQALAARLDDPDVIVRGEALVGLAKRQDERAIEPLRRALESGIYDNEPSDYARDALSELTDLEKYPDLLKWKAKLNRE